jgi:hypothetical protein
VPPDGRRSALRIDCTGVSTNYRANYILLLSVYLERPSKRNRNERRHAHVRARDHQEHHGGRRHAL